MIKTIDVCKNFGDLKVLKNISLTVEPGEVVCIIGPSGSGKSTYLRSLNHLEKITSGKIYIEDTLLDDRENGVNKVKLPKAQQRALLLKMGMVFQRFNLFPHKTVLDNVSIAPIQVKKMPKNEARELAADLIAKVGLSDKLDVYPSKLSGGQQQRVAIAELVATGNHVFDERLPHWTRNWLGRIKRHEATGERRNDHVCGDP